MKIERFLQHRRGNQLTLEERQALEAILSPVVTLPRRSTVVRRGERVSQSTFLISGYMCRHLDDEEGVRQIVSLQTAGDFVDLHGYPLQRLDHDISTLSDCEVAYVPHQKLTELLERMPHLGRILWYSTLLDAAMHREWIFRLGRLAADGRVAHLLCETYARLDAIGLVHDGIFECPLTQQDFGDACALTSVHVNRTLRALREAGTVEVSDKKVKMRNFAKLAKVGEFSADYLYLDDNVQIP